MFYSLDAKGDEGHADHKQIQDVKVISAKRALVEECPISSHLRGIIENKSISGYWQALETISLTYENSPPTPTPFTPTHHIHTYIRTYIHTYTAFSSRCIPWAGFYQRTVRGLRQDWKTGLKEDSAKKRSLQPIKYHQNNPSLGCLNGSFPYKNSSILYLKSFRSDLVILFLFSQFSSSS